MSEFDCKFSSFLKYFYLSYSKNKQNLHSDEPRKPRIRDIATSPEIEPGLPYDDKPKLRASVRGYPSEPNDPLNPYFESRILLNEDEAMNRMQFTQILDY